ncbi:MAG TPA: putative baseplate assembly protein, partial [Bryobacteraceae bacterium]|nr:putative baseplate assembly protein [Bryobacteraceae bacterium]
MTNPASAGETSPVLPVGPRNTRLAWEYWDGNTWVELGVAEFGRPAPAAPSSFSDTSDTFSQDGEVTFQFGSPAQVAIVNGQPALWVRVRLIGGDYGRDVSYEADTARGYVVVPSTLRPPVIHSIVCGYRVSATFEPAVLIRRNDFRFERISPPFEPFQPAAETQPFVYLGFASPAPSFPARVLTLYFAVAPGHPETVVTDSISDRSALLWEYWDGSKWDAVAVRDDTRGLLRSGVVRFIVPRTLASRDEFDLRRFWFRVHRRETGAQFQPMIRRILLNTALASNTQTTLNEVLGSSNGTAGQMFQSARKPVLPDQKVQVLEPYSPGPDDLRRLRAEEGPDAIESPESGATGVAAGAVWVRWHEVPSFTGSSPRDRHYTVERDTGTLRFGDGVHGRIPFRVTNNIRMSYQTGGGVNGNVPALAISQLKTTVPYVDRAVNLERASGGADPEPLASLTERAPLMTRHNFRAVATEDFEDLARLASPEVARAKCVPNIDLRQDPEGRHPRTGVVSVILAPHSPDPMPMPDFELFDRVRGFLDDRRLATFDVVLAGPEYVRVDITAEIAVSDPSAASETEIAVEQAVVAFLHPVNGGRECHGWKFGQIPHQADLYSLIECMPGVEHVRSVQVAAVQEATGAVQRGRFLICAGVIRITASLD